ncbi:hypothetical protein SeLEV6574_g03800 [Synchytrium endobioticum]|nr:hypothetical protein SeLEV6574_g03800 [Synchytrium endobioticum]
MEDPVLKDLEVKVAEAAREVQREQIAVDNKIKEYYEATLFQRLLSCPLNVFDPNHPQVPFNAAGDYIDELSKLAHATQSSHLNARIDQDKRKAVAQKQTQERLQVQIQELQARFAKRAESFNPPTQWFMLASASSTVGVAPSANVVPNDGIIRVLALDAQYRVAVTERSLEIWRCAGGVFGNALDDGQESCRLVGIVKPGHVSNITAVLDVPTHSPEAFAADLTPTIKDGPQQRRLSNLRKPSISNTNKEVNKTILLGCADGQGVLVDISVSTESSNGITKTDHQHSSNEIVTKCTIQKQRKLSSSAVRQGVAAGGLIAVAAATGLYLFTPELETRFSWPADALLPICKEHASRVPQPETQSRGVSTSDTTVVFVTTDASRRYSRVFALLSTGSLTVIEWLPDESKSFASWVADLGTRPPVDCLGIVPSRGSLASDTRRHQLACVSETTLWTFDPYILVGSSETKYSTGCAKGSSMYLVCLDGNGFLPVMVVINSYGILQMFQPGIIHPAFTLKLVTHLTDPKPAPWKLFVVDIDNGLICASQGSEYVLVSLRGALTRSTE